MSSPVSPPLGLPPGDALAYALFAQSPLSTVVYDAAGHVTAANAAFERLFGLRLADLPRSYSILTDPQLAAQGLMPDVQRAFAGEAVTLPPVRYVATPSLGVTTTTWTQAHVYPLRDAAGAVTGVVLVHLDLTTRIEAEEALHASESRLRLALEAGQMAAWEWTVRDGRVRWSEPFERMHGFAPGVVEGTSESYQVHIHPRDRARVLATAERTLSGDAHELEYRIVRPDGEVRWLSARGQLVRDAEGLPDRVVGVCTDVTDARRTQEGTRLLAEAGAMLAGSLEQERTLTALAQLAVPALADVCIVDVPDETQPDATRHVAASHADRAHAEIVTAMRILAPSRATEGLVARTFRLGVTQTMSPVTDDALLAAMDGDAAYAELLRSLGTEALCCVPLVARDTVVATMLLVSAGSGRRFGPDDRAVAEELAHRAAVAVDNARLHEEALSARATAEDQAVELELQAERLQEQATELEAQQQDLLQARDVSDAAARDLHAILGSISDPFVVYDREWRFRYINAPARTVFQTTGRASGEDALLGRSVWELYPMLDGTDLARAMRRAASERASITFEGFYREFGNWSEVRCFPMPDDALAVSWRDVTTRRQAAEAEHYLAEATAILASSLDYDATLTALARLVVPRLADWCSVDLVSDGGRIERVAVAHVDPEKVQWAEEIHRRYPPRVDDPTGMPNVLRTGVAEMASEITDAMLAASIDDPEYLALLRSVGLRSAIIVPLVANERTLGALSLISAESGRRYGDSDLQLAQELGRRAALAVENARLHRASEEARAQAEAANRSKTDFLAAMSHELRTPLNAIGGYTDLLLLGVRGPITDEQREDLERVGRSQRHLLGVINDILNFVRVEAGFVDYQLRNVAVADLLSEVEPLARPQLRDKALDFSRAPSTDGLRVLADPEKVRQVLLNLLANAIKFTEPGGRIWMSAADLGHAVALRVHDTGIGIAADRLPSVFEPFVQVHRTLAKPVEGTGLGLAISRDLARGMGGDLTAESTPGVGSIFTLTLPRATS